MSERSVARMQQSNHLIFLMPISRLLIIYFFFVRSLSFFMQLFFPLCFHFACTWAHKLHGTMLDHMRQIAFSFSAISWAKETQRNRRWERERERVRAELNEHHLRDKWLDVALRCCTLPLQWFDKDKLITRKTNSRLLHSLLNSIDSMLNFSRRKKTASQLANLSVFEHPIWEESAVYQKVANVARLNPHQKISLRE